MTELSPWYVTGFCDGEAAFTYSRNGGAFGLYFSIHQRADNKQIIEDIWDFFGNVGYIYNNDGAAPTKNSGFTNPNVLFRVTKVDELSVIVDHFDKYPLQSLKKREAYSVWREMVMHKMDNFRSTNYDILRALAVKLSSLNSQSRAFKVHSK